MLLVFLQQRSGKLAGTENHHPPHQLLGVHQFQEHQTEQDDHRRRQQYRPQQVGTARIRLRQDNVHQCQAKAANQAVGHQGPVEQRRQTFLDHRQIATHRQGAAAKDESEQEGRAKFIARTALAGGAKGQENREKRESAEKDPELQQRKHQIRDMKIVFPKTYVRHAVLPCRLPDQLPANRHQAIPTTAHPDNPLAGPFPFFHSALSIGQTQLICIFL